jgi:hypothetical protein
MRKPVRTMLDGTIRVHESTDEPVRAVGTVLACFLESSGCGS